MRGDAALRAAIRAANEATTVGAEYVAHFLGESERMGALVIGGEETANDRIPTPASLFSLRSPTPARR